MSCVKLGKTGRCMLKMQRRRAPLRSCQSVPSVSGPTAEKRQLRNSSISGRAARAETASIESSLTMILKHNCAIASRPASSASSRRQRGAGVQHLIPAPAGCSSDEAEACVTILASIRSRCRGTIHFFDSPTSCSTQAPARRRGFGSCADSIWADIYDDGRLLNDAWCGDLDYSSSMDSSSSEQSQL